MNKLSIDDAWRISVEGIDGDNFDQLRAIALQLHDIMRENERLRSALEFYAEDNAEGSIALKALQQHKDSDDGLQDMYDVCGILVEPAKVPEKSIAEIESRCPDCNSVRPKDGLGWIHCNTFRNVRIEILNPNSTKTSVGSECPKCSRIGYNDDGCLLDNPSER